MLHDVLEPWMRGDEDDLIRIERDLSWMQRQIFDQYEPDSFSRFGERLGRWLGQVEDEDERKAMFRLLRHLFFVGREQFASLYRSAYRDVATRWLIDEADIDITADDAGNRIREEMRRTWFCPVTDSMRINSFLKTNDDGGHTVRPDWRSLAHLGDPGRIGSYIERQKIARVALVEDFVGSGSQMRDAVEAALGTIGGRPILVVPLICCPTGDREGRKLAEAHPELRFEPVMTLAQDMFLVEEPQPDEYAEFTAARPVCASMAERYGRDFDQPFGFQGTGALVVLHTNCPDNSLPLLHAEGSDWKALFPRVNRNDVP